MNDTERNIIIQSLIHMNADQIFRYYREGIITMNDIQEHGVEYTIQEQIKELINESQQEEEDAWNDCLTTISKAFSKYDPTEKMESLTQAIVKLDEFIANYPSGNRINDANRERSKVELEFNVVKVEKEAQEFRENEKKAESENLRNYVLDKLREDPNSNDAYSLQQYLKTNVISKVELSNIIGEKFSNCVENYSEKKLNFGNKLNIEEISNNVNEIYFWGLKKSGKTTAIGSTLSYGVNVKTIFSVDPGNGQIYGDQLSNIFSQKIKISILPQPTDLSDNQYIPVTFKNQNTRSSFFDLSGELFQCFYYKSANQEFPTERHHEIFNEFCLLIGNNNTKHHFFFVDYVVDNYETDIDGLKPSNYINAAIQYFESSGIFNRTTKSIYIVVTKIDHSTFNEEDWQKNAEEKVNEDYLALKSSLEEICKRQNMNGDGKLKILPFSIGNVKLKELCEWNPHSADLLISEISKLIVTKRNKFWDYFTK